MSPVIDGLEEMDPKLLPQNRLKPAPAQFVACGAHKVDQITAETKHVCCIECRLIVARYGLVQIGTLEERVQQHGLGGAVPLCARFHVVYQQGTIAERFLCAASDDIGFFDDVIADHQQDVTRTIIIVSLSLPMDGGEFGVMRPCLRPLDGDTEAFKDLDKPVQILLSFFNDLLREGPARYFGYRPVGKFCELGAQVSRREPRIEWIANDDLL